MIHKDKVLDWHSHSDMVEAYRVLEVECQGLMALKDHLNHGFVKAVDIFATTKGRVVVTGVGKSGHIGRKISSTLASTGTPSFFIHPVEASHGDLGMLQKDDALLVLSNSGETKELTEIISFARLNHMALVAVTKNDTSTLAKVADVCLLLPPVPEACPLELAPTTSSLATLALGDTLAMVLLKRRGFTPQDFGRLHPGGKLGARLIKVSKLMHTHEALPLVPLSCPMGDVLLMMTSKSLGCAGVIDEEGHLVGIITDGDLRRHMGSHLLNKQAVDVMTSSPHTLAPHVLVDEAKAFMSEKKISVLFIVDNHKPIGLLHLHDFLTHERLS